MYRCINDVNEIPVSDNTLVVMFGFPGVGKSFAAEKIAEQFDAYIASSDAIREELFGTAACQDEPNKVFGILQHRATEELKAGGSVIIDATALIRKYRVSNLKTYEGKFKKAIVVVCCTDLDIAFNQNKNRDRHVPEEVIMHMFKTMSFPRMDEGWDEIYLLKHPDNNKTMEAYLNDCDGVLHNNTHHPLNIKDHMLACESYLKKTYPDDSIAAHAARYHDLGKPISKDNKLRKGKEIIDDKYSHYYGHADISAYLIACATDGTMEDLVLSLYHMDHYFNKEHLVSFEKLYPELKESYIRLTEADEVCDKWGVENGFSIEPGFEG